MRHEMSFLTVPAKHIPAKAERGDWTFGYPPLELSPSGGGRGRYGVVWTLITIIYTATTNAYDLWKELRFVMEVDGTSPFTPSRGGQ
jgi:hypothetical protein